MTLPIQTNSPNFTIESAEVNAMSYKQALQNLREHIDNMSNPYSAEDVLGKFTEILKHEIKYKNIVDYFQSCFQSVSLSESTKSFINELGIAIKNYLDTYDLQIRNERITQIGQDLTELSEHQLKDVNMSPELQQLLSMPELKRLENSDINEIINCININEDTLEYNLAVALEKNSVDKLEQNLADKLEIEKRLVNVLGSDVVRDNINPQLENAGFGDLRTLLSKRIYQYLEKKAISTLEKELPQTYIIKKVQGKRTLEFRFVTVIKEGCPDIERQMSIIKWLSWIFYNQQKKPESIILTNCASLTNKKLWHFWHDNLKYLDLRYSSIDTKIVETISHQCKNLKKLYLSKCDQLEVVTAKLFNPGDPLKFPKLKILHIARCANLTKVNIDAPNLQILKANNNAKLKEINLSLSTLAELNVDNCPLLENIPISPNSIVKDEISTSIPSIAFGRDAWIRYFGDIGSEPPLPKNIGEILNSRCSFWPDKKVKETHLLVLIPNTVNGKPFTMNYLEELIQKPKSGHSTKYRIYSDYAKEAVGEKSYPSHWLLMTRDIIPGSRGERCKECSDMIANHRKKTGIPYELPNLLEATASILMHYVKTGERLYSDDQLTYTWSQDVFKGNYPLGSWRLCGGRPPCQRLLRRPRCCGLPEVLGFWSLDYWFLSWRLFIVNLVLNENLVKRA